MLGVEILKNIFALCRVVVFVLAVVIAIINQHGGIVLGAGIINYQMINSTAKSSFFNKIYDAIVKNRINNFNGFPWTALATQHTKKKSIKTPLIWPIIIYVCERLSEFNVPAKYQLVSAVNR